MATRNRRMAMRHRGLGLMVLAAFVGAGPTMGQTAGVVEVPLRLQDGRLVVSAQAPDGAELDLYLSTGSPSTVLSESAAARVGEGPLTVAGLPVPLDGRQIPPDDELILDGTSYAGMITSNMLNRYEILIDVPNGRLVLAPIGPAAPWDGVDLSEPVPLRIFHGVVLSLDIELGGRSYPAMLELGTPRLLVNERVIEETGIEERGTLRVGGATIPDVPVSLSDHPVIARFSPNGDGFVLLGTPLLADCAVAISWARRELRTCLR